MEYIVVCHSITCGRVSLRKTFADGVLRTEDNMQRGWLIEDGTALYHPASGTTTVINQGCSVTNTAANTFNFAPEVLERRLNKRPIGD